MRFGSRRVSDAIAAVAHLDLEQGVHAVAHADARATELGVRFGGLDEFDEHPARVLRVYEIDARASGTAAGLLVEEPDAARAQRSAGRVDVRHGVRELLDARSAPIEE